MNSVERRHLNTLKRRRDFLRDRINSNQSVSSYDHSERDALTWAVQKLEPVPQDESLWRKLFSRRHPE